GEITFKPLYQVRGIATRHAKVQRVSGEMSLVVLSDVLQGDGLEPLHGSRIHRAVGMILVEGKLEGPLGQILVVVAAQTVGQVVHRLVPEAAEILGIEAWRQYRIPEDGIEAAELVPMALAEDHYHFLVRLI